VPNDVLSWEKEHPKTATGSTPTGPDATNKPAPCSEALQKVSLAQARERINRHVAHIEERKKLMTDSYYYAGAVQTLETAFKQKGISASMNNAGPWGKMGIGAAQPHLKGED
jgi:hypothetical protein